MKRVAAAASSITLALALALALVGPAVGQVPFSDPEWAPDWFKQCTNPKQWAYWDFEQGLAPSGWQKNYPEAQDIPQVSTEFSLQWQPGFLVLESGSMGTGNGQMRVRMDNVARPDYFKQVWFQYDLRIANGDLGDFHIYDWLKWPGGANMLSQIGTEVTPEGFYRLTYYQEIWPQPDSEEINLLFMAGSSGTALYLDNVRMLTQCNPVNPVPEPASMALAGVGLAALAGLRRRTIS